MFDTLWWLSVSITVLINFIIAFIVYRSNPKSITHRLLSFMTIVLMLWAIFNFLALSPGPENLRLLWVRLVMLVTTPLGPLIFLLATVFPEETFNFNKKAFLAIIVFNIIIMLLAISPFMFTKLSNLTNGSFRLYPGPAILFYGVNLLGFLSWGFGKLIKKYKNSTGILRKQLTLFVMGTIISFALMTLTNFIAVVVFGSIKYTFLGPSFTLIMASFIAYAIVRHKLLDIKVIATEISVVVLVVVLLSRLLLFKTMGEFIVDILIFIIVLVFSYILVNSVSKEVKQREELQKLTEKLKMLDKQKDEFISVAAHELRAPMTAIKGYLSMIVEGDAGQVSKETNEFIKNAIEGNDRLIRLVNNMLNVGRIEEGRMVYQMGDVSLGKIAEDTYEEYKNQAESGGLKIIFDKEKELKDKVYVDQDRIYEVITNLISNAIKYTDKGSVTIKLSNPSLETIRCEVKDTGRGISEEEQKKLFQKFGRVESGSGKTIGSGLGLYISKLLVEKFQGTIGLSSKSGQGSTFWFELPLKG